MALNNGTSRAQLRAQPQKSAGAQGPAKAHRMSNPILPRLLSIKKACEYSGLTAWTLRSLIWSGELPVIQFEGTRKMYVDMADLSKVIEANKRTHP